MKKQRTALVTGAGKGLGAAFARGIAADGSAVMVNNRSHEGQPSSAKNIADSLIAQGFTASHDDHAVDGKGAADAIIGHVVATWGGLDILVLNAGITGPAAKVGTLTDADIRAVMEINFHANTALIDAALPHLMASTAGRILFIASSAGLYGVRGRASYAASKGALIAYARTLADELSRTSVRVNILAPYAATNMTAAQGEALNEALHPDKATAAAVWLTRPECQRTGETWIAGGNYFCRATAIESVGGGTPDATADWFGENVERLSAMGNGQEHSGAEAAFADFFNRAKNISKE
ncbi:MAG: NAD(P)-dependent dehydrogenase (short-subunit alcohol dehydrogenase family) [Parasphingorhabdus sp.]|jgi:NAD(P)-dependent dehydrogenase (short-subunit alcohol dehydrogenase family)|uniref:SDR family NAD(P)-dependent oxidoreductase n=1 Tax=Parasphingorhabdus sp. TaxID=2709688 RepID=UPI0039E4C931